MTVKIKSSSPLQFADLVLVDSVEFWDLVDLPEIPEQPDDVTYQVVSTDRIDMLAYRFYKDHRLWWVIAVANDMELLPTALSAGDLIRIPSPRFVSAKLFAGAAKRVS